MVGVGEVVEVEVTAMAAGGDGIARDAEGRVTFVAGALPDERVRATISRAKKDFANAQLVEVLRAAPDRVAPPCPFVSAGCGGCDWQHVEPRAQRRLKAGIVADALRRGAHLDVEVGLGPELAATGYRTTLRGVAAEGRFGFRRRSSHDAVAVDPCLVAHPLLAELVSASPYPGGEVVLRAGAATGERLVVVAADEPLPDLPDGVRVVTAAELEAGRRAWIHEEVGGRRFRVSARSFFQARPDGAEALVDLVRTIVGHPDHLVDLYGGVGLFAGAIDAGASTLVESSPSSIADAKVNLVDRATKVVRAPVEHWGVAHGDAVVADPPRAGLGAKGVAKVAATGADRLALVSCDPASLGRDARLLGEVGFRLAGCTLVDLFPHTAHVEVVSAFHR